MHFRYLSRFFHAQLAKLRHTVAGPAEYKKEPVESPTFSSALAPDTVKPTQFQATQGNITLYCGDAVVNAANSALMPGGGVCGAIFGASDFDLLKQACLQLGGCPTGSAKVTPSFGMTAPWIVHAVGPIWKGGEENEPELLAGAYRSSLEEAHNVGARSIAFPAISTGIYGYPLAQATAVAVKTIRTYMQENPNHFDAIDVLCFDTTTLECYLDAISSSPQVEPNMVTVGAYGL